jgi:hypothetical protein
MISIRNPEATPETAPKLEIRGNPARYLLHVSNNPLFREGSTVVSQVNSSSEYEGAWSRSINAIVETENQVKTGKGATTIVSVAVKTITSADQVSGFSNSIDVNVRS